MKLGIMVCTYYLNPDLSLPTAGSDLSLERAIELTAEAGYSGLELQDYGSGIFGYDYPDAPPRSLIKGLKEVADSHGVEIPAISAMSGNLMSPDTEAQIKYIRKWLDLSASIEVPVLKINLGEKPAKLDNDAAFETVRSSLKRALPYAKEYGIPLAPEMWPLSYPTSDPAAVHTLLKNIDSPYFRHTMDNYMLPTDWAIAAYRLLAPYAGHVHLSTPGKTDLKGAGKERFRFEEMIQILKSVGYDGYLMIEYRAPNRPIPKLVKGLVEVREMLEPLIA